MTVLEEGSLDTHGEIVNFLRGQDSSRGGIGTSVAHKGLGLGVRGKANARPIINSKISILLNRDCPNIRRDHGGRAKVNRRRISRRRTGGLGLGGSGAGALGGAGARGLGSLGLRARSTCLVSLLNSDACFLGSPKNDVCLYANGRGTCNTSSDTLCCKEELEECVWSMELSALELSSQRVM